MAKYSYYINEFLYTTALKVLYFHLYFENNRETEALCEANYHCCIVLKKINKIINQCEMSNKVKTWLTIVKLLEYWQDSWIGRTYSLQIRSLTFKFIISESK